MKRKYPWLMFIVFWLAGSGLAQAQSPNFGPLPDTAWQILKHARCIRVGGKPGAEANIGVVFDVNAPYGAKLFERLLHNHPDTPVCWVPIAYFHADSATIAAAILASPDPAAGLRKNFEHYDFHAQHGSYPLPAGSPHVALKAFQPKVRQQWIEKWGGYTPITIFRTARDRILSTAGYLDKPTLRQIIKLTARKQKADHGSLGNTGAKLVNRITVTGDDAFVFTTRTAECYTQHGKLNFFQTLTDGMTSPSLTGMRQNGAWYFDLHTPHVRYFHSDDAQGVKVIKKSHQWQVRLNKVLLPEGLTMHIAHDRVSGTITCTSVRRIPS